MKTIEISENQDITSKKQDTTSEKTRYAEYFF